MIWGRTTGAKRATRKWFAWRPITLKNGRKVWLETVTKYWGASYSEAGCWCYLRVRKN